MASFHVESRVQELIARSTKEVGYKEEGVGISARGLQDQVHQGLEEISEQNFRKRARNGSDHFFTLPILRRSPRLHQEAADSAIVLEDVRFGQIMEAPSVKCSQGPIPVFCPMWPP